MSIRSMIRSLTFLLCAGVSSGCEVNTCEQGANCGDEDDAIELDSGPSYPTCLSYCGRLSVCGAPQAADFDQCVGACEHRFSKLPEQTAQICACAEWSRCSDVIEGRCSSPAPGDGTSGAGSCPYPDSSCGSGGSPGPGTAGSGGGSGGTPAAGGGPGSGGSGSVPIPCAASCECPSGQSCVEGFCTLL